MPTGMFEYRDEGERRAIERAVAFVAEMHNLAQHPAGQVLGLCETRAVEGGRELLRATLQEAVQTRVEAAEEKKGRRQCACGGRLRLKRRCGREVLTAIGPIRLERWHGRCEPCGQVGFAADGLLGVDGWLTVRARRMACLAGLNDPFRKAERLLAELSGWSVDAETLRRYTHAEASAAAQGRAERTGLPEAFAEASGVQELHIDAGKVNTPEGWRDVKVAVFACRQRGPAATADDYEQRELPAPTARLTVAAVEDCGAFGERCVEECGV